MRRASRSRRRAEAFEPRGLDDAQGYQDEANNVNCVSALDGAAKEHHGQAGGGGTRWYIYNRVSIASGSCRVCKSVLVSCSR